MLESFLNQKKDQHEAIEFESVLHRNFMTYDFNGNRDKTLQLDEYLIIIRPYLKNFVDSFKSLVNGDSSMS